MIKDTYKLREFGSLKMPKLKGHFKVVLRNVHNGKTEIIEGDNMITNALADIFASNLCGVMDYRPMLPIYEKMFGGVLCFKEELDVSSAGAADDYYIPDNSVNQVTAHAGQTNLSDQADDVSRGNPLNTSMSVTDGFVTLAWEWGSAAGNGVIKSVGLTHSDVGDAGTGSLSNAFSNMLPNINSNYGISPSVRILFFDSEGYGYNMSFSGTTLTLTKYPSVYQKVGLVSKIFDVVAGTAKTKSVTMGYSYSEQPQFFFDASTNKIHVFYNGSRTNSVYHEVVDISDWDNISVSSSTWSNLDEAVGPLYISGNGATPCPLPYYDGYVYLPRYDGDNNLNGLLKVKISSTADQSFLTPNSAFRGASGVFIPNTSKRILAGKSFVVNNGVLYKTGMTSPDTLHTWNLSGHFVNASMNSGVGLVHPVFGNNIGYFYNSISKFYLATKFNLPTPVQKSASQAMVVTYTLEEVGDES